MRKFKKIKRINKRKIKTDKIYLTDWKKSKPFVKDRAYHLFYTDLSNRVLEIINGKQEMIKAQKLGKHACKSLALMITNYFEDYISEIGIWEFFIKKNQELYGWSVPFFYPIAERDADEIYEEDISFLVWFFLSKTNDDLVNPDVFLLAEIGEEVMEVFEEVLEDAPATDAYERYLAIPENVNFFDLKKRLTWMAFNSYLLGYEFTIAINESIKNLQESHANHFANGGGGELIYMMQDDYNYIQRSSLSAISTLEWFAGVTKCSEQTKQDILKVRERVMSRFIYQGKDKKHYHFIEIRTNTPFAVHRSSFDMQRGVSVGDECAFSVVNWKGDWWLSGAFISAGKPSKKEVDDYKKDINGIPFYAYSLSDQDKIWEIVRNGHQDFVDYFGEIYVVFKDKAEMQIKMMDFYLYQRKKNMERMGKTASQEDLKDTRKFMGEMLSQINLGIGKPLAAISVERVGMTFAEAVPAIIDYLQRDSLSYDETFELFEDLFITEMHPTVGEYLLSKFPTDNLKLPYNISYVNAPIHAGFLFRYFSPNEFGHQPPNMRLMPEGMNAEEFSK